MPYLVLSIDTTRPAAVMARKWSDFSKSAMTAVADEWQNRLVPLHFQSYSSPKYNYAPRRPSTLKRKERQARKGKAVEGGRLALIETALLRDQMLRTGMVRAFPTRLTVTHPTHVPAVPRNSTINLHEEILRILPNEDRQLTQIYEHVIARELANYKPRKQLA